MYCSKGFKNAKVSVLYYTLRCISFHHKINNYKKSNVSVHLDLRHVMRRYKLPQRNILNLSPRSDEAADFLKKTMILECFVYNKYYSN